MNNTDSYDALLEFLHSGSVPANAEFLADSCRIIPEATHQRICELKLMQRRLVKLQMDNANLRESWGMQVISYFKHKMLGGRQPMDEMRELSERAASEQTELQQIIDPLEMADDCFLEYRPGGEQHVRMRPEALSAMARRFFQQSPSVVIEPLLERFKAVRAAFHDFPSDQRILGLIAVLSATPDFDAEEFFAWDKRLLRMLYGAEATPLHPMTHDRFLIHAILYALPSGTIEDRYIAFRIGWELFRKGWMRHFEHQLRALASTAYLLRSLTPFPTEAEAFKEFYQEKLRRYSSLMRTIHARSNAPDQQMGRGVKTSGSDLDSGPGNVGDGDTSSMFEGVSLERGARIGIPDPVFVSVARLVGLPATVGTIYKRLSEMLQAFSRLNDPVQLACVLTDTPLYFMDRKDKSDSFQQDEPGEFASKLRQRTREVSQSGGRLGLNAIHAALLALQPGPVKASMEVVEKLFDQLSMLPEPARRLVSFLLMDGAIPLIRHRRFAYELWFAEGIG